MSFPRIEHGFDSRIPHTVFNYLGMGIEPGKGSGKHLFSRGGRIGKTVGFPGVRYPVFRTGIDTFLILVDNGDHEKYNIKYYCSGNNCGY
jgi:hypothetical protein